MTGAGPIFPPLLRGVAVTGAADPFERARALAALGCDGGTIVHDVRAERLRAALVLAPEVPLEDAMAMLPACAIGFQNALGALAPPEVAVHLAWDGGIRVNGARCGRLRAAASDRAPDRVPDWLAVGLEVPVLHSAADPGAGPDATVLGDEGCAEVQPLHLLESWARHTLVWINRWSGEGNAPLHAAWIGLVQGIGGPVSQGGRSGVFVGVDERFGMLIRDAASTHLVALSTILEPGP